MASTVILGLMVPREASYRGAPSRLRAEIADARRGVQRGQGRGCGYSSKARSSSGPLPAALRSTSAPASRTGDEKATLERKLREARQRHAEELARLTEQLSEKSRTRQPTSQNVSPKLQASPQTESVEATAGTTGGGPALVACRRFAGTWAFRLWVEDCVALGGARVHAMNEVTGARACVELSDTTLSVMLTSFSSGRQTASSTHNVDEFLVALLDAVHLMAGSDGLSVEVRLPSEVPQSLVPQPIDEMAERRQAWDEIQGSDATAQPSQHTSVEMLADGAEITFGKSSALGAVETRSTPESTTVNVEPEEVRAPKDTIEAQEVMAPMTSDAAHGKAVVPSMPCPAGCNPSRPPGRPHGRPLGRPNRPTCRPGHAGVTTSSVTNPRHRSARPQSAPHGVRRQQISCPCPTSASEHDQAESQVEPTDASPELRQHAVCERLSKTDDCIPMKMIEEDPRDPYWSTSASRTWPPPSDRPRSRRNRPVSAKALKHRRVIDDGIDSIIYEDEEEDQEEQEIPESSGGQAFEPTDAENTPVQAKRSGTGGCESCRSSSRGSMSPSRSGSRSRPASASRSGRVMSPRPPSGAPEHGHGGHGHGRTRPASARRPRSARADAADGRARPEAAPVDEAVAKRLSWSTSASRLRREDGAHANAGVESDSGHALTLGGGPRTSSPPRRHVMRMD